MADYSKHLILDMVGGLKVAVQKPLRHLSTFVLKEQADWFEYEIKFLRKLLKPGMQVIDIGANFGLYSLSMAQSVGSKGRIWSFEPASQTAEHLQHSIMLNGLNNIALIEKGLSDQIGSATFHLSDNPEFNSLSVNESSENSETIELTTLNQAMKEYKWPVIDFIKLDAEGEESKIIDAADDLLSTQSPLIMFELKHGKHVNYPLIDKFKEAGYQSYFLVPGLDVLIPYGPDYQVGDEFLLNLFCCKDDTAHKLIDQGFLVQSIEQNLGQPEGAARQFLQGCSWSTWQHADNNLAKQLECMLDHYIFARYQTSDNASAVAHLIQAHRLSKELAARDQLTTNITKAEIATRARIAIEMGDRYYGAKLLHSLFNEGVEYPEMDDQYPFIPALGRYDELTIKNDLGKFLQSSCIEQWILSHALSAFYTASRVQPRIRELRDLGYMDKDMYRRYKLITALTVK